MQRHGYGKSLDAVLTARKNFVAIAELFFLSCVNQIVSRYPVVGMPENALRIKTVQNPLH